jgi:hypothetical protein
MIKYTDEFLLDITQNKPQKVIKMLNRIFAKGDLQSYEQNLFRLVYSEKINQKIPYLLHLMLENHSDILSQIHVYEAMGLASFQNHLLEMNFFEILSVHIHSKELQAIIKPVLDQITQNMARLLSREQLDQARPLTHALLSRNEFMVKIVLNTIPEPITDETFLMLLNHPSTPTIAALLEAPLIQWLENNPNRCFSLLVDNKSPLQIAVEQNNLVMAKLILGVIVRYPDNLAQAFTFKQGESIHSLNEIAGVSDEMTTLLFSHGVSLFSAKNNDPKHKDETLFSNPMKFKDQLLQPTEPDLLVNNKQYWIALLTTLIKIHKRDYSVHKYTGLFDQINSHEIEPIPSPEAHQDQLKKILLCLEAEAQVLEKAHEQFVTSYGNRVKKMAHRVSSHIKRDVDESNVPCFITLGTGSLFLTFAVFLGYLSTALLEKRDEKLHFLKSTYHCHNLKNCDLPLRAFDPIDRCNTTSTTPAKIHDAYVSCNNYSIAYAFTCIGLFLFCFATYATLLRSQTVYRDGRRSIPDLHGPLYRAYALCGTGLTDCFGDYHPENFLNNKSYFVKNYINMLNTLVQYFDNTDDFALIRTHLNRLKGPQETIHFETLIETNTLIHRLINEYSEILPYLHEINRIPLEQWNRVGLRFEFTPSQEPEGSTRRPLIHSKKPALGMEPLLKDEDEVEDIELNAADGIQLSPM